MNDIIKELNIKYKFQKDKLLIYKEFTSEDFNELLQKYNYNYILDTLINYVDNNFEGEKQNLLGTGILRNVKKVKNEIENNNINDISEVNLYYTNYNEVQNLIKKLDEKEIKKQLKLK